MKPDELLRLSKMTRDQYVFVRTCTPCSVEVNLTPELKNHRGEHLRNGGLGGIHLSLSLSPSSAKALAKLTCSLVDMRKSGKSEVGRKKVRKGGAMQK